MADAFASGALQPTSELVAQVPWPDAASTFTPGGFVPSETNPSASAPVCAPGFSLLLAPLIAVGGLDAAFILTPIAGALLVWLTFVAGRRLAGPIAGAMAAVLMASSPALLYQVVQPMNDVTTAALWMATFVGADSQAVDARGTLSAVSPCSSGRTCCRSHSSRAFSVGSREPGVWSRNAMRFLMRGDSVWPAGALAEQRPLRKPIPHRLRSARTPLQPVRTLGERITIFQLVGRDPHAFSAAGLCRAVRRRAREARRCGACNRPHSRDLRDLFLLHALR